MWKYLPINIKQRVQQRAGFRFPGNRVSERGFDIRGIRSFEFGDSFRSLSRRHYVRTGETIVLEREPERQALVLLLLDISASLKVGADRLKYDTALELVGHFSRACLWQGHPLQILAFSKAVELESHVVYDTSALQMLLAQLADFRPIFTSTDHRDVFDRAAAIAERNELPADLICIISDFLFPRPHDRFLADLEGLCELTDIITLIIRDRMEQTMPYTQGALLVRDAETGALFQASGPSGLDLSPELEKHNVDSCMILTSATATQWFETLTDFFLQREEAGW
jgi:uncharacterized protein (DUF58 family)